MKESRERKREGVEEPGRVVRAGRVTLGRGRVT